MISYSLSSISFKIPKTGNLFNNLIDNYLTSNIKFLITSNMGY